MDVTKPYEFIGSGAMDVTKPYYTLDPGKLGGAVLRRTHPTLSIAFLGN